MKVTILSNLSYQTLPATDNMVEVDEILLQRIGIDKQFDKDGNIIDYVDNRKKLQELTNWFDNYFDKQLTQSQWQDDFTVSHDDYFDKDYANIDELKAQAKIVRNEIRELRK